MLLRSWCCRSVSARSRDIAGLRLVGGGAEDVGAQVVAGHRPSCQRLDREAVARRDIESAGHPLRNQRRVDPKGFRQWDMPACSFNGFGDCIHAANLAGLSTEYNRVPKCADERQRLASLGMAAPLSADPEAAAAAVLFRQLLEASDYTHETFAAQVEVSPGRVSQWATNRGSVPWDKARVVAGLLGTKPALISPGFRRLRDEFLSSHLSRLDAEIVSASQVVARAEAGLSPSQNLDMGKHADAIASAVRVTLLRAIQLAEGSYDELAQGNGADRRIDRAQSQGQVGGQAQVTGGQPKRRAAGGAGGT